VFEIGVFPPIFFTFSEKMNIGFLEYLRISGEIRYPNGPVGY
jgi:hypothetical protein